MVHFDRSLPSRFGVLPRYYQGDPRAVRWFQVPDPVLIFHTANAWDEWATRSTLKQRGRTEGTDAARGLAREPEAVNLLACAFKGAKLVHAVGNLRAPEVEEAVARAGDVVRLTYFRFPFSSTKPGAGKTPASPSHHFVLSAMPFEFPRIHPRAEMRAAQWLYGCSMRGAQGGLVGSLASNPGVADSVAEKIARPQQDGSHTHPGAQDLPAPPPYPENYDTESKAETAEATGPQSGFDAALGANAKVDVIVKVDVQALVRLGRKVNWDASDKDRFVDRRSADQILAAQARRQAALCSSDADEGVRTNAQREMDKDPIRVFGFPPLHYAQECSFVPRADAKAEDDGYLLTYVYDERNLRANGDAPEPEPGYEPGAGEGGRNGRSGGGSELWILDAALIGRERFDGEAVVGRVKLPQRVPYGLHGTWLSEAQIARQRPGKAPSSVSASA